MGASLPEAAASLGLSEPTDILLSMHHPLSTYLTSAVECQLPLAKGNSVFAWHQ